MKNKNQYSKKILVNWWNSNNKTPEEKWNLVCEYALRKNAEFFQQLFNLRTCLNQEGWVAQKNKYVLKEIGFIN